ncbi:MAG: primase protein [Parcubacteria group bacterium GW2011_GWA2_45_15]|nr:MAG: primase protein [Parcubacteria group bacterium GW2011_GWA2_45_15]
MRSDVDTIKERLGIAEIVSGYIKLEKAGTSLKARCPFHNEKTPSFFVSPVRQSFYCFGCGAKGDIFTFVESVEGLDFRGALKLLAEKAGVEIKYHGGESKTEKDKILAVLEEATKFFEKELAGVSLARRYIASRGISDETVRDWRIGYAPAEWRSLYGYLQNLGYERDIIMKAGLIKKTVDEARSGEPYDVFRDRVIFPLADSNGSIIAFSGRALTKETEPKYLNSPDTVLFTKSEVLYGLDKAKDQIRKRDYAVLVEGQIDLVLSHQYGVRNSVASSGTAFTRMHLERLKRLSSRIIIAFDGDPAGEKAAEKASILGISLGLEVKVANLPEGLDPAEVIRKNSQEWKDILRESLPAVEFFFNKIEEKEKDPRKLGKQIEKRILPMIKLIGSTIEQSHFISLLAKRTSIKEEILWEDLKKAKKPELSQRSDLGNSKRSELNTEKAPTPSHREQIKERLAEIKLWQEELSGSVEEALVLKKEETELMDNLSGLLLRDNLSQLLSELSRAEVSKDEKSITNLTLMIQKIHGQMRALEEKKKIS